MVAPADGMRARQTLAVWDLLNTIPVRQARWKPGLLAGRSQVLPPQPTMMARTCMGTAGAGQRAKNSAYRAPAVHSIGQIRVGLHRLFKPQISAQLVMSEADSPRSGLAMAAATSVADR
jgi:hypothetical protein